MQAIGGTSYDIFFGIIVGIKLPILKIYKSISSRVSYLPAPTQMTLFYSQRLVFLYTTILGFIYNSLHFI
jgi:hypothetical protein